MNAAANEILLPRTDAGAGVQVIVVVLVTVVVAALARRERSLVTVVDRCRHGRARSHRDEGTALTRVGSCVHA